MKNGVLWIIVFFFLFSELVCTSAISTHTFKELPDPMFHLEYNGDMLYVGGNGSKNYSSIQSAIDNASIGDTIFVYSISSPYYENVIIKKNNIKLVGEDNYDTIIDGNGIGHVIEIIANGVTIQGFTIQHSGQNDTPNYDAGIHIYHFSRYNNITGNIIIKNRFGICIQFSSNNTISMNRISNNVEGIMIFGDSVYNIISENNIGNNNYGIHVAFTVYNSFIKNNIVNNTEFGIYFSFVRLHVIQKNNFINNTCHVYYIERLRLAFDRNYWLRNYWDTWIGFGPKLLKGQMFTEFVGQIYLPWINFDYIPARKPYTIPIYD
jgi:parallel beta-helix repeat protein